MHSVSHALVNGLVGYVLGLEPSMIALLVIAGVAIDLDHFLYYLFTTRKSIPAMWRCAERHWLYFKPRLFFFHTLEFNILVLILGLIVHPFFLYLELAFVIHMLLDVYDYYLHLGHFRWAKHWFVTYYVLRYLDRKAREASKLAEKRIAAARRGLASGRRRLIAEIRRERRLVRARVSAGRARLVARVRRGRVVVRSSLSLRARRARGRGSYARARAPV